MSDTITVSLQAIYGTEITLPPLPKKRKLEEDEESDDDEDEGGVPDVIQGEIARLQRQFRVTLDPSAAASGGAVSLVCHMEDSNLPSGTILIFADNVAAP